ncbi:hypothetical protein JKF63_04344 [Porcisia hertigi]|uniref:C3H1-type domain-containing protein n=1 Tax=Porcisia hertigi TaxID=2761500 RepID=A0A836IVV0_9TRYP|nr:hypothetical protein JKF63_04344 [Porcisia hertigi]
MSTSSPTSSRLKKVRCKKWDTIDIPSIDELEAMSENEMQNALLPGGFCVRFFRHDMDHLFTVASIKVKVTRGVLDYLHDYNQLGPNKSRNRLFLCSQYNTSKECMNGALCREVHCVLNIDDAQDALQHQVPSNATGAPNIVTLAPSEEIIAKGLNEPVAAGNAVPTFGLMEETNPLDTIVCDGSSTENAASIYMPDQVILRHSLHTRWTSIKTYPTLPAGVEFRVALPNTPTPVDTYDSSLLFVTRGAQEYFNLCLRNEQPTVTMQHCAHYSKNGICCFGEDCQFVHVVHYKPRNRPENAISDPEATSICSCSTDSDFGKRRGGRRVSAASRETPLSTQSVRRKKRDSINSSNSTSSTYDSSSSLHKMLKGPSSNSLSSPNNCVFVPSSNAWPPLPAGPGSAPAPLPQHFQSDQMMISSMASQHAPLMNQTYMVMPGLGHQCYFVQPAAQSLPQTTQQPSNQSVYVVPMPFQ